MSDENPDSNAVRRARLPRWIPEGEEDPRGRLLCTLCWRRLKPLQGKVCSIPASRVIYPGQLSSSGTEPECICLEGG